MSLLGTQVFANPDTPIWLSANGGTIEGDLTVTGTVAAEDMEVADNGAGYQIVGAGPTVVTRLQHVPGISPRTILQTNDPLYFNQLGQVNGNTTLTTSAPLANADVFVVGGAIRMTDPGNGIYIIAGDGGGNVTLQSAGDVLFTEFGQVTGNSSYALSTAGTNADVLTWGGTVSAKALELEDTGAAATVGSGTLMGGSAILNTTASDVTSYIFVTRTDLNASTAVGELRVVNKSANTFQVDSVDATGVLETNDQSSFDWMIVNPA